MSEGEKSPYSVFKAVPEVLKNVDINLHPLLHLLYERKISISLTILLKNEAKLYYINENFVAYFWILTVCRVFVPQKLGKICTILLNKKAKVLFYGVHFGVERWVKINFHIKISLPVYIKISYPHFLDLLGQL